MIAHPWIALAIAPLAAPIVMALGIELFLTQDFFRSPGSSWGRLLGVMLIAAPFSYAVTLAIGAPVVLILRALKKLSFGTCLLITFPLGTIAFFHLFAKLSAPMAQPRMEYWLSVVRDVGFAAAMAFAVAFVYCAIAGIAPAPANDTRGDNAA